MTTAMSRFPAQDDAAQFRGLGDFLARRLCAGWLGERQVVDLQIGKGIVQLGRVLEIDFDSFLFGHT